MRPGKRTAMQHQASRSDYREVLATVFAMMSPEVGQIEWLLDRIEGTAEGRGWA